MSSKALRCKKKKLKGNILEDSSFILPQILTKYSDEELFLEFRVGRVDNRGSSIRALWKLCSNCKKLLHVLNS